MMLKAPTGRAGVERPRLGLIILLRLDLIILLVALTSVIVLVGPPTPQIR